MVASSILISGCNRGIGIEFVRQLATLEHPPTHIFAGCRNPTEAHALQLLSLEHTNIYVVELDVTRKDTVKNAKEFIEDIVGEHGLHVLFNNAATKFWNDHTIDTVNMEQVRETYEVNAIGPLLLTQTFLPLLQRASRNYIGKDFCVARAAVLNMSTMVASIADNTLGQCYSYRMSKTALNMMTKNLSIDLQSDSILVAAIHPGWVKTRMGGIGAKISASQCVERLIDLFRSMRQTHHGNFYNLYGKQLPW